MAGKSFFKFFLMLLKTNISQSYALKLNFWMEVGFMTVNNLLFFVTWIILFHRFQLINGWSFSHLMLMMAVVVSSYSIYAFGFRGLADTMAGYIERGELDTFLLQPRNILLNVSCSRSSPSAVGDFTTGVIFFFWSGLVVWQTAPLAFLCVLLGFSMFLSMGIFIGSLAFYLKDVEGWGLQLMNIILSLSTQPGSIYTGGVKMFMMFVLPVGVLTFLPVEAITRPNLTTVLTSVGVSLMFFGASVWFFHHGLRRYESGNSFGVRS